MKKHSFHLFVIIFCVMVSTTTNTATLKLAANTQPPIELEKGWNLISVPCDIDSSELVKGGGTEKLELKSNNKVSEEGNGNSGNGNGNNENAGNGNNGNSGKNDNGNSGNENGSNGNGNNGDNGDGNGNGNGTGADKTPKFYAWNGEGYEEATYLYRGVGYIVNTNNIQNSSSVCEKSEVVEPMGITLKKGWNLMGNPYHKSYKVENIFGTAYASIDVIYEYSGNKYSELKKSDHFKPWRGYWVFVEEVVDVPVFIACALTLKSDKSNLRVGEKASLEATYICMSNTGDSELYDVTEDVKWINSDENVGVIDNGVFLAKAEGSAEIKATFKDKTSVSLNIKVMGDFNCDKVIVAHVYEEEPDSAGYCGNYSYFPYSYMNIHNESFSFYGLQCRQCGKEGAVKCTENSSSNFHSKQPVLWSRSGELPLKVYCVDSKHVTNVTKGKETGYVEYQDITDKATWEGVSSSKVLKVSNGKVTGKMGSEIIRVKYGNITSLSHRFLVIDPDELFRLTFELSSITTKLNSSIENRLFAIRDYNIEEGKHESVNYYPSNKVEDVTNKASYENEGGVSYVNGSVVTGAEASLYGRVNAKYNSKTTYMNVKILNPDIPGKIFFKPYDSVIVYKGEAATARLYGIFYKDLDSCVDLNSCATIEVDITDVAEYKYDNKYFKFEKGILSISEKQGLTFLTATYKGKTAIITVRTVDPNVPVSLFFKPQYISLFKNQTANLSLYAKYYNYKNLCDYKYENSSGCMFKYVEVSDKAEVTYDKSLIKYENGVVTALGHTGYAKIEAEFEGVREYAKIELLGNELMMLKIDGPMGNEMSGCPVYGCYATNITKPIMLRVYAWKQVFSSGKDITSISKWEISDPSVATIDETGKLTPKKAGKIWIRASYEDARSDKTWIYITDKKKDQFLAAGIGSSQKMLPLKKGDTRNIYSALYKYELYDSGDFRVGLIGYVSADGIILEDSSLVSVSTINNCKGQLDCYKVTGAAPGFESLNTTYQGLTSNSVDFEVWQYEEMKWCNSNFKNINTWSDSYDAVAVLETDCAEYKENETVKVRYTAKVPGGNSMFLDNCLDMWILDENDNVVKTFRNEGCSSEEIGRHSSKTVETVYQVAYDWDMTDDNGEKVPKGQYYATARFYIYYEPVIHLLFTIK